MRIPVLPILASCLAWLALVGPADAAAQADARRPAPTTRPAADDDSRDSLAEAIRAAVRAAQTDADAQPEEAPAADRDEEQPSDDSGQAADEAGQVSAPLEQPPSAAPPAPIVEPELIGAGQEPSRLHPFRFWPNLDAPTLGWIAAVVTLALTLRPRQVISQRSLDGLVFAAACVLYPQRSSEAAFFGGALTAQWWALTGLAVAAGYFAIRGIVLLVQRRAEPLVGGPLPGGAATVLTIAGLALCIAFISTRPVGEAAREGFLGGLKLIDTGTFPYGDDPKIERHSPLFYSLYAGVARVLPAKVVLDEENDPVKLTWTNRDAWIDSAWSEVIAPDSLRLANGILFIVLLASVISIGQQLFSARAGLTMGAVLCFFPGTHALLDDAPALLAASLVALAVALAVMPRLGGLLGPAALALAGLAWPWAWLGLPVLMGGFLRRGGQALASIVSLVLGASAVLYIVVAFVNPATPRADGMLALAGLAPSYTARINVEKTMLVAPEAGEEPASGGLTAPLWAALVRADPTPVGHGLIQGAAVDKPTGAGLNQATDDTNDVKFWQVDAKGEARTALVASYRGHVGKDDVPPLTRGLAAIRTVIESTWTPAAAPTRDAPSAWHIWSGGRMRDGLWLVIARIAKALAVFAALWAMFALFAGKRRLARQMFGGLLAVFMMAALADPLGAGHYFAWVAPVALGLWAAYDGREEPDSLNGRDRQGPRPGPVGPVGAEPRITVTR